MEPKFKIGDEVIVLDELETIIEDVWEHDGCVTYSFLDKEGNEWSAWEEDIQLKIKTDEL